MSALFLKHGRVVDPISGVDQVLDVRISSGRILEVGAELQPRSERVLEARDLWVLPGLVDLRCTIVDDSDVESALAGGLTALMLTPESPRCTTGRLDVRHANPLTRELKGEELGEVPEGVMVLSNGFAPIVRGGVLRRALQYAQALGVLVMVHPEDPTISARGLLGEGPTATRLGLLGVPAAAETSIVARDLEVLRSTGGRLHFSHLTCARSVQLVREAKLQKLAVTCDVTGHHLTLDDTAANDFSLSARVWPPLRSAADVVALREGVKDGAVDAIASDHLRLEALDLEHAFEQSSPGIEAFASLVKRVLSLGLAPTRVAQVLSTVPAKLMGLGDRTLAREARADVTVIDPRTMTVHATIAAGELRFLEGRTLP